jgi:hypothetical protein
LLGRNLNEHDFLRLRSFIVDQEERNEVRRLLDWITVGIASVVVAGVLAVIAAAVVWLWK